MTDKIDPKDLIPSLLQGKLNEAERDSLLAQISDSPELQQELEFWRGVNSIRAEFPKYDFSEHLPAETLDRLARGELNSFSAEYSRIAAHLESCEGCSEELEMLRQALVALPEEILSSGVEDLSWFQKLARSFSSPGVVFARLVPLAAVLLITFMVFSPLGDQNRVISVLLAPKYETRNVPAHEHPLQYTFTLRSGVEQVDFQFTTDRLDLPSYGYSVLLMPNHQAPIALDASAIECSQSRLSNRCVVTIKDAETMALLRQGGSFAISIEEELPPGSDLEPIRYEYHFRVLTN